MAYVVTQLANYFHSIFVEHHDARIENLPLMGNKYYIWIIVGSYIYFVKNLGPKLMKDRQPFQLKSIMAVYNILQVLFNGYLVYKLLPFLRLWNFRCENIDFGYGEFSILKIEISYGYFLLKIFDMIDTVFIILRKKSSQISFLHLYHHAGVCLGTWIDMRYFPGGHTCVIGIMNLFVHVVMYSYYFLSVYFPSLRNSKLKTLVTQIQLIQFILGFIHFAHPLLMPSEECTFPKFWLIFGLIQTSFMLAMFGDFYFRTYIVKHNKRKIKE